MTLNISRIRALCFDVDGTISDTDDLMVKKIETLLTPLRLLFPNHQVGAFSRRLIMASESPANMLYHLLDRFGLDDEIGRLFNYLAKKRGNRKAIASLIIPDVKEMIQKLHGHYPMAIVSARDEDSTLEFLEQFSLRQYFQCVATAQTCNYTKPFPDPILWAAQNMNVKAEECLMIGDTTVDIRAGKAAGAQTVGVLCGFGQANELKRCGANLILTTTAEITNVLLADKH